MSGPSSAQVAVQNNTGQKLYVLCSVNFGVIEDEHIQELHTHYHAGETEQLITEAGNLGFVPIESNASENFDTGESTPGYFDAFTEDGNYMIRGVAIQAGVTHGVNLADMEQRTSDSH